MKKIKSSTRLRFPEDEKKHSWLPMLLDAYEVINRGISLAIRAREKERRERLACGKGCSECCRFQKDVPIYPLEMVGIYWYVIEKTTGPLRVILRDRLSARDNTIACPFLVDDACSIHPLRPIGCRQFNVFNASCGEGEDPYYTRRDDVLTPIREYTERALSITLPFYGVTDEKLKAEVIRKGAIHSQARVLQSLNWKELVKRMDDFDSRDKVV